MSGTSAGLLVDLPLLLDSGALNIHVAALDYTRACASDCSTWHFHGVYAGTAEWAVSEMDGQDMETMKGGDRASMSKARRDVSTRGELCNGGPTGDDGGERHRICIFLD